MEQTSNNRYLPQSKGLAILLLVLAAGSKILAGPKLSIAIFGWLTPLFLLYFFRITPIKRKLMWAFLILYAGNIVSSYNAIPFPLPILAILTILSTLKELLIYFLDRKLLQKSNGFIATLFFPAITVAIEYISTKTGGGAWWSVANSQYSFTWFIQLASVTGIWGISFMLYWFASVAVWAIDRYGKNQPMRNAVYGYSGILLLVIVFGAVRTNTGNHEQKVKIAGLSAPSFGYLEAMYKTATGKDIKINPHLSVTSPELQQVNLAQISFIETGDTVKYKTGYNALQKINDSLFVLSQKAADAGARIISWSEANAIGFRFQDKALVEKGSKFAAKNKVYLLMAMAIMDTGKIYFGKKFIENKAVFIGPDGAILNVFHKNKPVPFAESSKPGDGKIPVIATPYGIVSTSICYDADFPREMQQLSGNKTDILLLPSGDWYSIAPYHTHMAVLRGIENGCSLVRQASGGLSVAVDNRGNEYAHMDFFKDGTKLWVADVPVGHVDTVYSVIGDILAYACMLFAAFVLLYLVVKVIMDRRSVKQIGMSNSLA